MSVTLLTLLGTSSVILSAQTVRTALPGTVNYVEGQASIEGKQLNIRQNGNTQLEAGQTLTTGNGKVEILLSPGVFVRTGSNSAVRMVSPELVNPTVEVVRGEAMVEVDQKPKDARVSVLQHGGSTTILKEGLYRFDSDQGRIEVIDGKAQVTENGSAKEFGKGKQVALDGAPLKAVSFDRNAEDDLYRWSSVRSDYLAEANASTAQDIYRGYGSFWGPGWYWNPWFTAWSWLPGDGYFYSPFGYPFFSPAYVVYAPHYGFRPGVRGGYAGNGPVGQGFVARGNVGHGFAPRGGVALGAPRSAGFAGGGGHGRR